MTIDSAGDRSEGSIGNAVNGFDGRFQQGRRAVLAMLAGLALAALLPGRAGAAPAKTRFGRGLLWRVSRRNAAPSYIFGTIHLADPRVLALVRAQGYRLARAY